MIKLYSGSDYMNPSVKKEIMRYSMMLLGCFIYAIGFCLFMEPNNIVAGGITGLTLVFKEWLKDVPNVSNLSPAAWLAILNAPIIIISFFQEGFKFTINCLITILVLSGMTKLFETLRDSYNWIIDVDMLTACLFGGVLQGIAIGIYCKYKVSSGGTELIGRFLYEWTDKKVTIPLFNALSDAVIVIIGVVTFKNPANFLYAILVIFLVTKVSDAIIVGLNKSKMVYIITTKGEEVGHFLVHNSPRGVTLINGKGMYTDNEREVLLTVVKKTQINQLKEWVKALDSNAFVIVSDTTEVMGNGFKHLIDEDDK
jgi:uncharacterized membrane-anchored protein YitT (DUF2179 family)